MLAASARRLADLACRNGVTEIDGNDGLKFENSALSYQAAIDELGIVVAQRAFVEDDLRTGRLVTVFDLQAPTGNSYFLAYPVQARPNAKVRAFEEWILNEASALREAAPQQFAAPPLGP